MNTIHDNGKDDKSLNDDLEEIRTAYTRTAQDEPPEMLDQAILNRAHRAVEKKPRRIRFSWLHGLTTTAVFVLAFSLVLNLPETTPIPQEGIGDGDSALLESVSESKVQPTDLAVEEVAPAMKAKGAERQEPSRDAPADELRVEKYELLSTTDLNSVVIPKKIEKDDEARFIDALEAETAYESQRAGVSAAPVAEMAEPQTIADPGIEQELQAIIKLKRAGDDRWISELESFRERHPDYPIPDELAEKMP